MSDDVHTDPLPRGQGKRPRDWKRAVFITLLLLPAVAFLLLFMYYPIEETFRLSLMKTTGLDDAVFTGLENYFRLFKSEEFLAGLWHVFVWAFWSVVVQIPLAFFIAFSLIFYANRLTRPLRSVYYLANIIPSTITAMIGLFVFASPKGVIATLAARFHWEWLRRIDFLGDPKLAFWAVFTVATWTYTGFYIIYLMARIEQISPDIREAAMLDGAGGWKYARYIVLPMVSYPLQILTVLCVSGSMKVFDLPFLITKGGPGHATATLGTMLYRQGFVNWQYGSASAVGVIILVLSLAFTITQFSLQRKGGDIE